MTKIVEIKNIQNFKFFDSKIGTLIINHKNIIILMKKTFNGSIHSIITSKKKNYFIIAGEIN